MNQTAHTTRRMRPSAYMRDFITRHKRTVVFLGAFMVLMALIAFFAWSEAPGPDEATTDQAERVRTVTVVEVSADTHAVEITGFAEVHPRWSSTLRAQVSGTLVSVAQAFQPGAEVKAGEMLAVVDSTAWVANLAEAENRLGLAELSLLREQQEADEARRSWRESGLSGEPDSRLVLYEPQIEAARSERDAARAARDWAAEQLTYTRIRAPFTGVITVRHISRGESILEGEPVAQIYATDAFELALPVPEAQWPNLPDPVIGTTADLVASDGPGRWQATVVRQGATIDPTTRMRTLYLSVHRPLAADPSLLPGTFVQVHLRGRPVDRLLELPEGVLTRNGHVWYVDDDGKLNRFETTPLFTRQGHVYIAEPESRPAWRIVRYPLESYLVGQTVLPERTDAIAVEGR